MNVGFISLGCSKNLIDTEVTIGKFKEHKFTIVNDATNADIIVVNTCGFIDSAKEEAIQTLLEMADLKQGRCKYLIAMGCLVQRYYEDLKKSMPEVDLWIKLDEYDHLWDKIEDLVKRDIIKESKTKSSKQITKIPKMPMFEQYDFMNKTVTTGKNFAYLKIGEGCSNRCTYCAIPYIRGPFVSRKEEDIIEEAQKLAEDGIKELIVIAQDTTKYGEDIYGENKLAELLKKLSEIEEIKWIRFLYSYPEGITDNLIDEVASNPKIAKYFDIPIQHISNKVLKRMNRKTNKEQIESIISNIRNKIPNVVLRTSLIVGFPGETDDDFRELEEFVEKTKFDKLGTFMYSKEEGTPAARLPEQIHGNTKKSRYNKIMSIQQKVSNENLKNKIGKNVEVLIEDISFDGKYLIGRTSQDVPEEDGIIYVENNNFESKVNSFVNVKVTEVKEYDLIGKIV